MQQAECMEMYCTMYNREKTVSSTLGILRKILDKLAYYDKYPVLEENMSYSNIGGTEQKNVRNHLFIVWYYQQRGL